MHSDTSLRADAGRESSNGKNIKDLFLLDPQVVFLNHGSFGATPRPVFESYQRWQRRLEAQPVLFLGREYNDLLYHVREALAGSLSVDANDLVMVPNATHGVNIVARSLDLRPGDEVLATNHEYGACDYTWEFLCGRSGARYKRQPISLPVLSDDQVIEQFWQGVSPQTRVIFLSHITSATALRLPVAEICRRARERDILTIVDGAHAFGQVPLDLRAIGADFYTSNCHKWGLSPKGAAFLFSRPEVQALIKPLVVSWGYHPNPDNNPTSGSQYVDYLQWTGTKDPAACLAVPDAISFMRQHHWERVIAESHALLREAIARICELTGLAPAYPLDSDFFIQMGIAPLPSSTTVMELKNRLYDEFRIEVPLIAWEGQKFVRISVQAYNDRSDTDRLLQALRVLLPLTTSG